LDDTLHPGVPVWLERPLREWIIPAAKRPEWLAQRAAMRLRLDVGSGDYLGSLYTQADLDLLAAADAILQLHPGWYLKDGVLSASAGGWTAAEWRGHVLRLRLLLKDAGSLYDVDVGGQCLVTRVSPELQQAKDLAMKVASPEAADHLQAAWKATYGLGPQPDTVFSESIRAIEEVACPLIEERKAEKGVATLGTAYKDLETNSAHKWELLLPQKDGTPQGGSTVVAMMRTLWDAQRSRHGGGSNSRRMTQAEAEAAVHLTVVLVHWLSTGVLRKRP
jgi:hypothetical protein